MTQPSPAIGQSIERREDARFLAGTGCFVDDIKRPGMAHAVVVRSAVGHGLLAQVDTSEARAMPGVLAIYTFADIAELATTIPLSNLTPLPGFERFLQMPLANGRVVYVGEPVALVVAENRYVAEDAADLVRVDYDMLDAVASVDVAATGDRLVHPEQGTNVATHFVVERGDAQRAFREAPYTRKERLKVHRHSAVPLETRGLVAEWTPEPQRMRVWGAAKLLFRNRTILAGMLRLPESAVELIEVDVGGSFGVRGEFYPEDFLVPFAAMRLGRPVKWIEDRREHFMATNHSREMTAELEIAVNDRGEITALRGRLLVDQGAYVRPNGGVAPGKLSQFLCGPYRIRDVSFDVTTFITNKTPFGSYRGPGRYESAFFRERLVDLAANDLGIDPAEFRRRNMIGPELMPWDAGALVPGAPTTIYDTGDYPAVMARALREFDYERLRHCRGTQSDGRLHGVGIGCFVESTGGGPSEGARLRLTPSGQLHAHVGSSSAGQGVETVMAQIVADELGVGCADVLVFHGSTTLLDKGWGSYHSRSVVMGGSALILAARKLRLQLLEVFARRSDIALAELCWDGDRILRKGGVEALATLATLGEFAATDDASSMQAEAVFSSSTLTYTFGTQLAHVAVDPETAAVEVLKFLTVEDVGRMINPAIVHGQTLGASVQGLGSTLLDEFVYDDDAQLLTASFADYLLATSTDFVNVEAISLEESRATSNPLGAKGAGEGGIAATGAALANAVSDALKDLGVTIRELPLSPNRIAALMRDGPREAST